MDAEKTRLPAIFEARMEQLIITKEQLVANIAAGLQEIREIEAGKRQSVSFQDFMKDAGTDED